MDLSTRVATESDPPFLCEADKHLSREDQMLVVSAAGAGQRRGGGTVIAVVTDPVSGECASDRRDRLQVEV